MLNGVFAALYNPVSKSYLIFMVILKIEIVLLKSILAVKGSELKYATSEEDRNKLWKARHDMHWAIRDHSNIT